MVSRTSGAAGFARLLFQALSQESRSTMTSSCISKRNFDLSAIDWTVAGYQPTSWMGKSMELGFMLEAEISPVAARVPGSVQSALREAGQLPDWFEGINSRACEWVENRDWMFSARLPDAWFGEGRRFVLNCDGLDGNGIIVFNKKKIGDFDNAFIPHQFDLTEHVQASGNELHVIFCVPPRWLGQVSHTSQMKDWKPRFNYTWDWLPRLVQIGPWEPITLAVSAGAEIGTFRCRSDWDFVGEIGTLWLKGTVAQGPEAQCRVRLTLRDGATVVKTAEVSTVEFASGVEWRGLQAAPWWPNGAGSRVLYAVTCELVDDTGQILDRHERTIGFKHVTWQACAGAPAGADPWICVINGRPIFLQGINWTPILPTFGDLTREHYLRLVELYRDLGCNILRVWGGAYLEKSWFYELCDEHGLLVWQEFPLCSAGHENWPHEDEPSMAELVGIAESYIVRRQHHASLLMWCGGNELQGGMDGGKVGIGIPVGLDHPLMQRWLALVAREDPGRRFVPTSASGPRFMAHQWEFGKGLHWDVHGPWKVPGSTPAECASYWNNDDALFRSETGAPGASSAELIRHYAGGLPTTPGTMDNPLWRRFAFWLELGDFIKEHGHEPSTLDEYVDWSRTRQATAIAMAITACKTRFPGIGGIILWMGHDAFPCTANTSIIEFDGRLKPAAIAASRIWRSPVEVLQPAPKA
jgi:beta-mannosidase